MTSPGDMYTVCEVWGTLPLRVIGKIPYFFSSMEEEKVILKS